MFSLLHEDRPGLHVQDPVGSWHRPEWRGSGSWILIVDDMLSRLSNGFFLPTAHRVAPTPAFADSPRHSIVFFQALDELEEVIPLPAAVACRSSTGGYRKWWNQTAHGGGEQCPSCGDQLTEWLLVPERMTQREWVEKKENAAKERLKRKQSRQDDHLDLHSSEAGCSEHA